MALGKGLGAILEEVGLAYEQEMVSSEQLSPDTQGTTVEEIDVSDITPNPYQPRKYFDEEALQELSESIKNHGLLQPIVVLEKDNGYLLIAGERRLRAHKLANIGTIKAIVADVDIDTIRLRELALIENIQRENLNSIELANSYAELIEVHNITHNELSAIVHKSRSQITNTMRLLTLSKYTQEKLTEGSVSQGHAKILVGLSPEKQQVIVDTVLGQKLSVRETENLVQRMKKSENRDTPNPKKQESFTKRYEKEIQDSLPFQHKIKDNKIEITFKNKDELIKFIQIIKKT